MISITTFIETVKNFYVLNRRNFPWRETCNPFHILISELMLQQTQTHRVIDKYQLFIEAFPEPQDLAHAPFMQVLGYWQGLGYNRRALFLHRAAQEMVTRFEGKVPDSVDDLQSLPGIGPYTASAVCTFAFNQPLIFIETNIRTVFIHHFFEQKEQVHDKELIPFIEATLDTDNPREWYYALMDYGVYIKATFGNKNKQSKHYTKQSKFEGSDRQIRGMILRYLLQHQALSKQHLFNYLQNEQSERLEKILMQLHSESLIYITNDYVMIAQV